MLYKIRYIYTSSLWLAPLLLLLLLLLVSLSELSELGLIEWLRLFLGGEIVDDFESLAELGNGKAADHAAHLRTAQGEQVLDVQPVGREDDILHSVIIVVDKLCIELGSDVFHLIRAQRLLDLWDGIPILDVLQVHQNSLEGRLGDFGERDEVLKVKVLIDHGVDGD